MGALKSSLTSFRDGPGPLLELCVDSIAHRTLISRYIVVNLTREAPDFSYETKNEDDCGILEIVGFPPHAMKVIEAYSKNCFV